MENRSNKVLLLFILTVFLLMPVPSGIAAESSSEEETYLFEPIVVTAQKRSETQNAVPISLDVKTEEELKEENITTVQDVFMSSPNVATGMGLGGTGFTPYFAIRGVGSAQNDMDPSIGVFVDGVPLTVGHGFLSNLLDVEQVEILRGPQGTLYGRNTLGGAINISSKKADPSQMEGHVSLGGGNKEQINTEAVLNVPLMEGRAAIRGAVAFDTQGEIWENLQDADEAKQENFQGRLSYFQLLGENTSIDFSADIQMQDHLYTNVMTLDDFNNGKDTVNLADPLWGGTSDSGGAKLEVNHDLDNGHKFSSITGYRTLEFDYDGHFEPADYFDRANAIYNAPPNPTNPMMGGFGFTGFQLFAESYYEHNFDQISQEFRWTSPDDEPLRFVLGLYGDYNTGKREQGAMHAWATSPTFYGLTGNHVDVKLTGDQDSLSLAAFADASYDFNDTWQVFGGLRVGYDKKDFSFKMGDNQGGAGIDNFAPFLTNTITDYEDSQDKLYFMPRLGLKYNINEDNNIYASASRGYKAGGFMTTFQQDPSLFQFDEETTVNYELGMKNTFFDGPMTVDSALFYIDWKDQQVLTTDPLTHANSIINAPKSRSYGFEIDVNGYFDNGIRLGAGAGYADATYVEFDDVLKTIAARPYDGNDFFDASGKQQQNHSKFTAQASAGYGFDLPWNELMGSFDVTYRYRSKSYFDIENTIEQPGYGTVGLNFGIENETYEIYFWANNLFDERSFASAVNTGGQWDALDQNVLVTLNDPRMFGASLTFKF